MSSTIFGLFRQADEEDPLSNGKSLAAWLQRQPNNDFLALQEAIVRLLEDFAARRPKITPTRVLVVMELDQVAASIQMRLMAQYLQPTLSEKVRQRLWHAADDVARWFAYVYEQLFEGLQDFFLSMKAKGLLPGVASRMFHYRGIQAMQGLFHYERWIPRRWNMLHAAYEVTEARGCAGVPFALFADRPAAEGYSAEEEFLQILLLQRVNTGNLTPLEIERCAAWLRSWIHGLMLSRPPLEGPGFWLDLGQGEGLLVRKPEKTLGALLYLDVAPLLKKIDDAMIDLSVQLRAVGAKPVESEVNERLQLLQRLQDLLCVETKQKTRRGERVGTDRPVHVAVSLPGIASMLRSAKTTPAAQALAPAAHRPGSGAAIPPDPRAAKQAVTIEFQSDEPQSWYMYDYSDSGCRLVSSSPVGAGHRLGALMGVQEQGDSRWRIAIVRRLKRFSGGRAELGVEVIAQHAVLIVPKPATGRDSGYRVTGVKLSIEDKSFDALYLPPTQSDLYLPQRTMVVPASEYFEHRRCALTVDGYACTVEFTAPNEQNKDWVWTTFEVVRNAG
ncbi:MAG: hypothetical protein ABI831_05780 [Betaproteobacteria bacterium]